MMPTLTMRGVVSILTGLVLAVLVAAMVSLSLGSSALYPWQLWGPDGVMVREIIVELRLPRTLSAFATGGLLALAGVLQQVLLRNPLADPYVLGTSGGASVGALLALFLGASGAVVQLAAGSGALWSVLVVFALSGAGLAPQAMRLLLTGVAMAAFSGAISSLLLSLAEDGQLRGMVFWMLGDLSAADWHWALPGLLALLLAVLPWARDLNLMALGRAPAHSLGVNTRLLGWMLYAISALATALAVTCAGMIGFVGLVVPHALRLMLGQDLRLLLPASVLGGGLCLLLAAVVARLLIAPAQLPVGVVMALAGAPVFVWLLNRRRPA